MSTESSERALCPRCREERELVKKAQRQVRHALPELKSPLEVVQPYACPACGCEVKSTVWMVPTDNAPVRPRPVDNSTGVERRGGTLIRFDGQSGMTMHYPAVIRPGEDVLFPAHEGSFGDGHAIDRHGDPDLMAEFAGEYLKKYRVIVPKGSLPRRLSEMMPALHLLVNAMELALKADLIRSETDSGGHSLESLYGRLEAAHRHDIEHRFAESEPNANLRALGCTPPGVDSVLRAYGTGLSWSPVYEETPVLCGANHKNQGGERQGREPSQADAVSDLPTACRGGGAHELHALLGSRAAEAARRCGRIPLSGSRERQPRRLGIRTVVTRAGRDPGRTARGYGRERNGAR